MTHYVWNEDKFCHVKVLIAEVVEFELIRIWLSVSNRNKIKVIVEDNCEKSTEMKELSIDEEVDNRTENDEKLRSALHGENEETNGKDLLKLGIVHTVVDYVLSLCSLPQTWSVTKQSW